MLTRRLLLKQSLMLPLVLQWKGINELVEDRLAEKIKIGACDWSIGQWSNIKAFQVAKEIGLEGIMVDVGAPSNNLHIRQKEVQQEYLEESKRTGIDISSLALGVFNSVPFHSHADTAQWVSGSIDAAKNLNVKVLLLAFFNASDLRNDDKRKDAAVQIIKSVIKEAEEKGIILGIESYLNAKEHIDIIDKVGSKNVQVYYDFRNTADAGFDTVKEFRALGKDLICELHMKENDFLLDKGTIDWKEVSKAINETNYSGNGWMQIEGALPKGADIVKSYQHNLAYLKKLFGK